MAGAMGRSLLQFHVRQKVSFCRTIFKARALYFGSHEEVAREVEMSTAPATASNVSSEAELREQRLVSCAPELELTAQLKGKRPDLVAEPGAHQLLKERIKKRDAEVAEMRRLVWRTDREMETAEAIYANKMLSTKLFKKAKKEFGETPTAVGPRLRPIRPGTPAEICSWWHNHFMGSSIGRGWMKVCPQLWEERLLLGERERWSGPLHRQLAGQLKKDGFSEEDWDLSFSWIPKPAHGEKRSPNYNLQGEKDALAADPEPQQSRSSLSKNKIHLLDRIMVCYDRRMEVLGYAPITRSDQQSTQERTAQSTEEPATWLCG